ncbi:MAG: extracellular solute-binding protein [Chloroflexi bacterium]|nr:extracellular solute-binding protein [Chloroflexota bacterium]
MKKVCLSLALLLILALSISAVVAQDEVVTLTMGSWRTEDIEQWDAIIAAFNEEFPNIQVNFEPTLNTEYDSSLLVALQGGGGPDLVTCRPFDISLALYEQGYLTDVSDTPGLENFGDVARSGWIADDGTIYCVPMASVLHGFIYSVDMFNENGWEVPATVDEFTALLETIDAAGITPLAMGTRDGWTNWTMGFHSNAPNWYMGEAGRQALLAGDAAITDAMFVEPMEFVLSWAPYLPDGFEAISYADTQQLFPLGLAAIFPAGSWEIPIFEANADFELGAFKPPVPEAGQECFVTDHVDIGLGMNANTEHPEAVMTFLEWVAGPEFAERYTNLQPGFFSLSDYEIDITNPLAQEMASWRQECSTTIRLEAQYLSRGEISPRLEAWRLFPAAFAGEVTVEEMAAELQTYLWYPDGE